MNIGIIGCGNMGRSMAKPLQSLHSVFLFDRTFEKAKNLAQAIGANAFDSLEQIADKTDVIIIAVKPKDLKNLANELERFLLPKHLVISVVSGANLGILKTYFSKSQTLRVMPNLAVEYGEGVIGIASCGETSEFKEYVNKLFHVLGMPIWIPENMMDALTSLTGSGPAFMYAIIDGVIEAALAMGFSSDLGRTLVIQMLSGCLETLKNSNKHPAVLKQEITSPGGTTIAGLRKFEEKGVKSGLMETFIATLERSKQMAQEV